MLVELSPVLLSALAKVNSLHMSAVTEDNLEKAKLLKEDLGRERTMLLTLLNEAVAVAETSQKTDPGHRG